MPKVAIICARYCSHIVSGRKRISLSGGSLRGVDAEPFELPPIEYRLREVCRQRSACWIASRRPGCATRVWRHLRRRARVCRPARRSRQHQCVLPKRAIVGRLAALATSASASIGAYVAPCSIAIEQCVDDRRIGRQVDTYCRISEHRAPDEIDDFDFLRDFCQFLRSLAEERLALPGTPDMNDAFQVGHQGARNGERTAQAEQMRRTRNVGRNIQPCKGDRVDCRKHQWHVRPQLFTQPQCNFEHSGAVDDNNADWSVAIFAAQIVPLEVLIFGGAEIVQGPPSRDRP